MEFNRFLSKTCPILELFILFEAKKRRAAHQDEPVGGSWWTASNLPRNRLVVDSFT